jgi:LacI family transcriptional regulator
MGLTIKDIAILAGVSKTTVSKVINKKDENISNATKEKILQIVKENNYVPNKIAQGLVTRKTYTIGLLIPDIRNPFFTEISRGVEDFASENGYNTILCNTDENYEKEKEYFSMLCEKMVDGIIFAPSSNVSYEKDIYSNFNTPVVLVDKNIKVKNAKGVVKVDNKNGTYEATKHLIKNGHTEILYLSGPLKNDITKERLNGYIRALEKNNLTYKKENIVEGRYRYEWAYEYIKNLEQINFTGVCCANDLIALGAIRALKEKNIKIPQEISIVGFDDIETAKLIEPPLTTIRQPAYEMGKCASEILINSLNDENFNLKEKIIIFKPELIKRNSTKLIQGEGNL